MKLATFTAAVIAAFLIGLSFASYPKPADEPTPLSIEAFAEYQKLLEKSRDQQKTILSLEFDIQNLRGECMLYKGQLDDAKTQLDSLRVQLAAATAKPSQSIATSLPVSGAACETGNCRVQQAGVVETYQPRFRLFRGRR